MKRPSPPAGFFPHFFRCAAGSNQLHSKMRKNTGGRFVFSVALLLLLLLPAPVFARDVTMNFAFNLNGKANNIIRANLTNFTATDGNATVFTNPAHKFVSAERSNSIFAVIFAGSDFRKIELNTTYASADYLISLTQSDRDSRFLLAMANATSSRVESKMADVNAFRMISKTIGFVETPILEIVHYTVRLETGVDIHKSIEVSGITNLIMKNRGRAGGLTNITVELK